MKEQNHRSTSRVLDIFELLAHAEDGLTLTEISMRMEAPKSSIFPIIHTMEKRQFVQCDISSAKYRIGYQTYLIGELFQGDNPLSDYINDLMKRVSDTTMETCNLGILTGNLVTYIAISTSPNPVGYRANVGTKFAAYCSGIGKALLMDKTKEELKALYPEGLERYTENTITDFDRLYDQIQTAKMEGYTYEEAEAREEIFCVAAPLRNKEIIVGALSVSVPQYRVTEDKIQLIKDCLGEIKKEIEIYIEKFNIVDGWRLIS
jgi:IclR family KDG regulon transcriptional repressor